MVAVLSVANERCPVSPMFQGWASAKYDDTASFEEPLHVAEATVTTAAPVSGARLTSKPLFVTGERPRSGEMKPATEPEGASARSQGGASCRFGSIPSSSGAAAI